jgi:hypothetical protein
MAHHSATQRRMPFSPATSCLEVEHGSRGVIEDHGRQGHRRPQRSSPWQVQRALERGSPYISPPCTTETGECARSMTRCCGRVSAKGAGRSPVGFGFPLRKPSAAVTE